MRRVVTRGEWQLGESCGGRSIRGYFDAKTFASESIAEKLAEDFEKSFSAAARTQRLDVNSFENKNPLPLSQVNQK